MLTRRKFLGECSLLAAAACLAPVVAAADHVCAPVKLAQHPGFAEFFAQINTPFTVQTASRATPLLLHAVTPQAAAHTEPGVAGNERFCLHFRGPAQSRLPQDTYHFTHPHFGALAIFIVPVGRPDPAGAHYEAVFDRPLSPEMLARQIMNAPRRVATT